MAGAAKEEAEGEEGCRWWKG